MGRSQKRRQAAEGRGRWRGGGAGPGDGAGVGVTLKGVPGAVGAGIWHVGSFCSLRLAAMSS